MNNKNNSFSKEYKDTLEIYKKLHLNGTELDSAKNTFDGKSLKFFFQPIKQVIDLTKSNSIIDFGCGKAKYYFEEVKINNKSYSNISNYWNIKDFYLYDPGVKNFSAYPPRKADGIICIDVVEHIPETDIGWVVDEIIERADKMVFFNIACYPALKTFTDGTNVHVSIFDPNDWLQFFKEKIRGHKDLSIYIFFDVMSVNHKTVTLEGFKVSHEPRIIQLQEQKEEK